MSDSTPSAKDLIELPGPFTFKIFSHPDAFTQTFLNTAANETLSREIRVLEFRVVVSSKGNYKAHTLTLHIHHYAEIELLYQTFKSLPGVVMML